ncbi:Uncharacterized protein dnl_12520 [Desulfonema limicola]|uniref:Uncharacterized protein n=1 Tax=Desulfonema limicola TaxID=45656 RepID=A0A975GFB1_9BACT|nr:Uncharacterized protein dnl_12520 [Desulfonema limicola]
MVTAGAEFSLNISCNLFSCGRINNLYLNFRTPDMECLIL